MEPNMSANSKTTNQYGDDPLILAPQDAGQVSYPASLAGKLYDLGQKGILTDAELEGKKKRILGS
jgi:hypothetical protein